MTTKKLVPRASGEGAMGVTDNAWGEAYYDTGNFNKGLFVSGHNITQVIAETVTQGGLGGEWTKAVNGLDIYYNGGKVGIGTTSPGNKLHISAVSGESPSLLCLSHEVSTSEIRFTTNRALANESTHFIQAYNDKLRFFVGGGATNDLAMTINSNGNVGIGTTDPNLARLQIRGDSVNTRVGLLIDDASGRSSAIHQQGDILKFDDFTNFGTRMVINCLNGYVGIGTTNPSAMLSIVGHSGAAGIKYTSGTAVDTLSLDIGYTGGGTGLVVKNTNGNVGIGTDSPITPLTVQGQNDTTFDNIGNVTFIGTDAYNSTAGAGIIFAGKFNSSNDITTFGQISSIKENNTDGDYKGALTLGTRDGSISHSMEKMRITSAGHVGIGTTNPACKLDIDGTLLFSASPTNSEWMLENGIDSLAVKEKLASGAYTSRFTFLEGGNVGIGSSSPSDRLQVVGDLRFGATGNGSVREASISNLTPTGFFDLALAGAHGFHGFLIFSITSTGNANIRTAATYSIFGRGSDFQDTQIAIHNSGAGIPFTLSKPNNGVVRLQNNSSVNCQSTMVFY